MAHIEGAFDQINERLGSIDRRLDAVDTRFNWVIGISRPPSRSCPTADP
jgi:hypothetical protein